MSYVNYYNWIEYYLENDLYWLDNLLSFENSSFILNSEGFILNLIYNNNFQNSYIFNNNFTIISAIDLIFQNLSNKYEFDLTLYNNFILDIFFLLDIHYLKLSNIYYLEFKNYLNIIYFYNPEIVISIIDFFKSYFYLNTFNNNIFTVNDIINIKINYSLLNYLNYFIWLILSFFFSLFILNYLRILKTDNKISYITFRTIYYFYSSAFENRINYNLILQFSFFIPFIIVFSLMTYSDSKIEFIELLHLYIYLFFIYLIIFLIYKYSIHYFSFLEASVIEGKSASFILKQFVRDVSNTFALFLRFFLLLFRLNVYDSLDDFLDSYYIFFCDFDDDNYYDELLVIFDNNLFYLNDNHINSNILNNMESDFFLDIFQKYYITWSKFFMFWAFILEEFFRISLALYISYLIIFEVHSVNSSYNEENYLNYKLKL